jgi:Family of unknown function (DUF5519)
MTRFIVEGTAVESSSLLSARRFIDELTLMVLTDLTNLTLFVLALVVNVLQIVAMVVRIIIAGLPQWAWMVPALYLLFNINSLFWDDYQAYLDLGRGGTPPNIWGWLRIKHLSLFKIPSVLSPPHVPPMLEPYRGLLEDIPSRRGARPVIGGVAPQRQTSQRAPRSTFSDLEKLIHDYADRFPDELIVEKSFLEGHTIALKGRETELSKVRKETITFGHEICHPHRIDGSIHMIMHPEDVKTVIESGWGERHPLARADWWWSYYFTKLLREKRAPVPETLVFVYAPRNENELAVVKELMRAAAWWITGVEMGPKQLGQKRKRRVGRTTSSSTIGR